ncbi:MAG: hypothetical protein NT116_02625, partial [Candidatus Parcubacteria bacterium]|nr:hypothetical protein [Candidatus Parcubacteria bacterium]
MKNIFKILSSFLIGFLFYTNSASAVAISSLSNVNLSIEPKNASSLAIWTISFTMPETSQIGHILVSLGGYVPDLSSANLSVLGLPAGTALVGKSNPSCVSNCDDVRYYFKEPVQVKSGTKITFSLNKVKNSAQAGPSGINFINVFSSKYPNMTLAFSADEQLITLSSALNLPEEELIPLTATTESGEQTTDKTIQQVLINELFYQPGAKTTKLNGIKDATKVNDFTLDLLGKARVTLNGQIDLSKPEAIVFIEKLSDYLTFDHLFFEVKKDFMEYFKVPLELTFYDIPFVWDADILKNDSEVIAKEASDLTTFSGRISDPKAAITIFLNGQELKNLKPAQDPLRGEFTFAVKLLEGPNLIEAKVQSEYGKIDKISKIVQYLPPTSVQPAAKKEISYFNIAAIVLAILAIILIVATRYLVK